MACAFFELGDFSINRRIVVKQIVIFQQVGFIGHDLLHPHRPLLIPGARQAKGFVPGGQLNGAGAGFFGQRHGQHFDQDPIDVVLGLLLGQTQRVDLNPIAEAAMFWVFDTIALLADFVPKLDEGAHFTHLGDKADARIHKEGNPRDHRAEILGRDTRFQRVENRLRRG